MRRIWYQLKKFSTIRDKSADRVMGLVSFIFLALLLAGDFLPDGSAWLQTPLSLLALAVGVFISARIQIKNCPEQFPDEKDSLHFLLSVTGAAIVVPLLIGGLLIALFHNAPMNGFPYSVSFD
ncbi:MAG: hypothetical protein ACOX81_10330 [Candidatus Heteroscillospira sp.]|jgi:hypothetical protein